MYQRKSLRSAGASSSAGGTQQSQNFPSTSAAASSQLNSQLNKQDDDHDSSENEDGEEYGDMHRLVLQGIMAAGYLDVKGVKKLFQESCKQLKCKVPAAEHLSPPFIQRVVREINERIKDYDMMIRSATCEVTGEKFYVFLVTIEKQVMKFQTYFTKAELDLFKKILDSLLRKHRYFSITETDCINIGGEIDPRSFSKSNAEDFVVKMISLQYFTKVCNNKDNEDDYEITLGFRTIREFEPIFREVYHDVFTNCCLCKMILLNGLQCPKCPAVIHRGCLKKYIKNCKTCVSCKGPWRTEGSLLIRARSTESDDDASPTTKPSESSGKAKKSRLAANGDEVDMPILEPMVSPRSAGTSASQSQKKASPSSKQKEKETTSSSTRSTANAASSDKKKTPAATRTRRARNRVSSDSE
ncbi:Non-structural maintenance of chromosomes element 1 [Orchesella cincta]|uniref:Non-structural maintenance of chromosomes element 1 homolog n=1 Tax=Orchesella cincta TaxID=48709 RepID=A0A1D2MQ27_ORCCI|nr:Non-structural maintenance of chromosomes element 1 [Orchesella cincta]